ncbi:lipoprotein transmembrane [Aquabacterium lacunae]|uniref:Lipoprotein transmembrane n=2 Tax=Aquabacterium lacunae TaxID=2528630 RepID=A0A4Q9H6E0_9BURK|nr:lipoprotein transmembrane [Aquabacterium lacunae]
MGLSATGAWAAEVNGIKFDDSMTVGGKSLVLNGLGVRHKVVKVYAVGLYLTEKKTDTAGVLALNGPKRFRLVTMRDISSEELAQAVLTGVNKNLDKDEKSKYVSQLVKFGELFNEIETGKKGDVIIGDYIPGTGTVITFNGKQLGQPLPDLGFYNAILRIWIGSSPADPTLKPLLLGDKPDA